MPPSDTADPIFGMKFIDRARTLGLAIVDLGTCSTGQTMLRLSAAGHSVQVIILDDWNTTTNYSNSNFDYEPAPTCDWSWVGLKPTKPNKVWLLRHTYGKLLSAAEKEMIRALNLEPTWTGIRLCQEIHRRVMSWIKSIPQMLVRFDRRVPCWRAGRWKSLT